MATRKSDTQTTPETPEETEARREEAKRTKVRRQNLTMLRSITAALSNAREALNADDAQGHAEWVTLAASQLAGYQRAAQLQWTQSARSVDLAGLDE